MLTFLANIMAWITLIIGTLLNMSGYPELAIPILLCALTLFCIVLVERIMQ